MRKALIAIVGLAVLLYGGDFLSLRLRIPRREPLGACTVHVLYAVKLKNGKTEYDDGGDQVVTCSNSLFPQMGNQPCWYARRHTNQTITIDSGNPNNPHIF